MKKVISIILATIMLFAVIPFSASADEVLSFSLSADEEYYIVSRCNDDAKEVVIPAEYEGKPVKEIADSAFMACLNLTSVVIPEGIEYIGEYAFMQCKELSSVVFPKSLKEIGTLAFWGCTGLESVVITSNTKIMSSRVFYNCTSLEDIYCEAESTPEAWEEDWNYRCNAEVHWDSNKIQITKNLSSVVCGYGDTAKVAVNATGVGLTYKWYFKNSGAKKFTLTNSFKGNSYNIKMNETRAGRQVYCVITNAFGKSVETNVATLGVKAYIVSETHSAIVQSGKVAKITINAIGDGLKYQWYYKNKGATKFTLTNTFKSNYYSVSMAATRAGRQVYCVITDKYGNSVKTKTVTLGMAAKITTQPTSVKVANGSQAKVTVKASGEGLKYKWYFKDKGGSKFYLATSFTGNYYSTTMTNARAGRQLYCIITDKYGNKVQTKTVTINKK